MYTHEKHPYRATCTQFTGDNHEAIISLLKDDYTYATRYGTDCIMVRFTRIPPGVRHIETLTAGWWVVKGENGVTKCYDDATFRVKYQEIKMSHIRYAHKAVVIEDCPFCANSWGPPQPEQWANVGRWSVGCMNPHCGARSGFCDTELEAIELWNKRPSGEIK